MDRSTLVCRMTLLLALCASALPAAADETGCAATIQASLDREERDSERVRAHFTVKVETDGPCADVTYDLIVEEMLPNLQWKSVRKTGRIKVHGGSGEQKVEHVMSSDLRLLGHEAKIVSCVPCVSEE